MKNSSEQPPSLSLAPEPTTSTAFAEEVISAFRVAVRDAQIAHLNAGDTIVVEQDGKLVHLTSLPGEEAEPSIPMAA